MLKKMEDLVKDMRPQIEAIRWEQPHDYANWLSQSYYIAERSTSFLGMCLFHAHAFPDFQARCTQHIAEETGHEKLLIKDIKNLGETMHAETPGAMAFYQPQYFRIVAQNPLSFLGYVFFLELLGPTFGDYIMERAAKAGKNSLTFLKVHTHADDGHLESAMEVFKSLPEQYHANMWSNFHMSRLSYGRMLDELAQSQRSGKNAA